MAGAYTFQAIVTNSSGVETLGNSVTVNVQQKLDGVAVTTRSSGGTLVLPATSLQLVATAIDQFGELMQTAQHYAWSLFSGVGSVSALGVFTAPASGSGSAVVEATVGGFTGTIHLTIPAPVGIFSANQDIGSPSPGGSSSFNSANSTYTVTGAGSDVYGTSDQLQYGYEPLTGDATITAYVASMTDANVWTKCGIMFRDSLNAGGAYTFLMTTPTTTDRTDVYH